MKGFSRRSVLRGMLHGSAVTVGLPLLQGFLNEGGTALACGDGLPLRFGLFFWGNGSLPDEWVPIGEGADWTLSPQLSPLEAVQDLITVVSGMSIHTENLIPHGSGAAGILTGAPLQVYEDGRLDGTFGGPSLDQIIAAEIGSETIYRSLETGVVPGTGGRSYNGPNNKNPPELNPFAFYERVFGASFRAPGEDGIVDPRLGLRRSVLDAVLTDIHKLETNVGNADKVRLDQHFTGVRELELRLARLQEDPPNLEACGRPDAPVSAFPDIEGRPQMEATHRAMADLLIMSIACDQTRVFSHWFSDPLTNTLYPDVSAGHHDLTHNEIGEQPEVSQIVTFVMRQLAYMVEQMALVPEGDGTMLDNLLMLATSEVSEGRTHSFEDMPLILVGNACGRIRQGVHHRSHTQENTSKLLLSTVRAMNINAVSFGADEGEVSDGLSAIET